MKIRLTRDSVCAADDLDPPHEEEMTVPGGASVADVAKMIQREYLPTIQGGEATWSLVADIPVAVIAQQWSEPRLLPRSEASMARLSTRSGTVRFHVNYHAQVDPELVFEVLRETRCPSVEG